MKLHKKSILYAICTMLLCVVMVLPVSAASAVRVVDDAGLLTSDESSSLLSQLNEISSRHNMDVAVVTVSDMGDYSSIEAYADDYYDYNGYAPDGIMLLVSMKERKWHMTTKGYGITAFTDAGLEYIEGQFRSKLSDGEYLKAFQAFGNVCDKFITQAESGEPYDVGNMPKKPFSSIWLIIALGVGLIIGFVRTGSMKASMKTVALKKTASDYVKKNSLHLTNSRDIFLYRQISRTERPKDNERSGGGGSSVHTSSSGSSHGGRSGSF